jgi:hypothetical protein
MVLLALLDLMGAFAAKEAVERRSAVLGGLGVLLFLTLFWVYASSLQYADLAPITFGWVVILQVGVLVLDAVRYDAALPAGKVVAVVLIILLQGYLLLGPDGGRTPEGAAQPRPAHRQEPVPGPAGRHVATGPAVPAPRRPMPASLPTSVAIVPAQHGVDAPTNTERVGRR